MTSEQRKSTRPDIYRTDVVFADGDIAEAQITIKSQTRENIDKIKNNGILKTLNISNYSRLENMNKQERIAEISKITKNFKGGVETKKHGSITFDIQSVNDILAHGNTFEKAIAIYAVPQILKNGVDIGTYNDENKSTYTIAGKIIIENDTVLVGVLISNNNHSVYGLNLTDEYGKSYKIKTDTAPKVYALESEKSNSPTIIGTVSKCSIPNNSKNVNTFDKNNSEVDYMLPQNDSEVNEWVAKENAYIDNFDVEDAVDVKVIKYLLIICHI